MGVSCFMKKIVTAFLILFATFSLIGCTQNLSSNSYKPSDVGVASTVKKGKIIAKRTINIDSNSGIGGLAGAGAGAAAGSMIGGNTATNIVGAIGGAVIGGLAGNAMEKGVNHQQGIEYIIKLTNGKTISVTQPSDVMLYVNQRVLVIYGESTRVVADETA